MMDTVVYWFPMVAMIFAFTTAIWAIRKVDDINDRLAREAEILAALDAHMVDIVQHARDHAEALMLWNHGARDEAIELLAKWGTRVHVA